MKMQRGINNLLLTCVDLKAGETVLLVKESPRHTLYSATLCDTLTERIRELGCTVTIQTHKLIATPNDFPLELLSAMERVDHTIFLSRIGDYSRFFPIKSRSSKTQCYALNEAMLSSHYAGVCYQLMTHLQQKLEAEIMAAKHWHIHCDLGTDLHGQFNWPSHTGGVDDEFSLKLFPVTTFKPISCNNAKGTVALSRWLMPGSAPKVTPFQVDFDGVILADIHDGTIKQLSGNAGSVRQINAHYDLMVTLLGANRNRVHSWHAGLNPHTAFDGCLVDELERWEGLAFASPRYLHLHTCGDTAPAEITWSVFNPTVTIDGEIYWQNGQLAWYQREDNEALIRQTRGAECLLEPSRCISV